MDSLTAGADLPALIKTVTQQNINRYAEASKDFNPIHIDVEFARKTPLGGTIAHGMLVLAYVSQMMAEAFGQDFLVGGKMAVRFKTPARPGDTLTVTGKIDTVSKQDDIRLVTCQIKCSNQKDEVVILGDARIKIPPDNRV
jgi:3-hydroxybutyryl-CoA dehydratase